MTLIKSEVSYSPKIELIHVLGGNLKLFFFSSRRRHTRSKRDWSSDVCSSDLNHASYVLTARDVRLMTDPWLFGSAFNNGWDLISETKFSLDDFREITHIWFSHEQDRKSVV